MVLKSNEAKGRRLVTTREKEHSESPPSRFQPMQLLLTMSARRDEDGPASTVVRS
jgi:hypothetical protein